MNCYKCGRETPAEQVFCEECLLEMEKHPIKPGTVVFLPQKREVSAIKKPAKKRIPSAEEQLKILRKHLRAVCILLILCICLILAMSYPTIEYLKQDHFKIGQNYNSVTVPTTSAAATDTADK